MASAVEKGIELAEFQVGDWRICPAGKTLSRSGKTVRLEPKVMEVLAFLARNQGQVVSKDQLLDAVWPDTFVAEVALSRCVSQLRRAFGDNAKYPRFIETIPKRGYRLIAPVSQVEKRVWESHIVKVSLALFIGSILLGFGGYSLWREGNKLESHAALEVSPLTSNLGEEYDASFSPDGSEIAFNWNGEHQDNWDIYVERVGGPGEMRLTTDPALDHSPVWSPDGQSIAFVRVLGPERAEVRLIPSRGGREQKLAEVRTRGLGRALAWSPDGQWLAVSARTGTEDPHGIFLLSLDSGELRRLTGQLLAGGVASDMHPAFSPDGRTIAFSRSFAYGVSHLFLLPLSEESEPAGPARQLTHGDANNRHPVWTRDGREILFVSGSGSQTGLFRIVANDSAAPRRLDFVSDQCLYPALSPDGNRLIYSWVDSDFDLYRVSLQGPVGSSDGMVSPERWISSTRPDLYPRYSPDGTRIAFVSQRTGSHEIWISDSDGSNAMQLTSFGGPTVGFPSWSPDGTRLVCHIREEQTDVHVIEAETGISMRLTDHPAVDGRASWSMDAQWIYFRSFRTGREEVWKKSLEADEELQVTKTGGTYPFESPEGDCVYYSKSTDHGWEIWKVSKEEGEERKVIGPIASAVSYVVVKEGIYFVSPVRSGELSLSFLDFATRGTEVVMKDFHGWLESVSPDRQWLLFSQAEQSESDLMLVEGFL